MGQAFLIGLAVGALLGVLIGLEQWGIAFLIFTTSLIGGSVVTTAKEAGVEGTEEIWAAFGGKSSVSSLVS